MDAFDDILESLSALEGQFVSEVGTVQQLKQAAPADGAATARMAATSSHSGGCRSPSSGHTAAPDLSSSSPAGSLSSRAGVRSAVPPVTRLDQSRAAQRVPWSRRASTASTATTTESCSADAGDTEPVVAIVARDATSGGKSGAHTLSPPPPVFPKPSWLFRHATDQPNNNPAGRHQQQQQQQQQQKRYDAEDECGSSFRSQCSSKWSKPGHHGAVESSIDHDSAFVDDASLESACLSQLSHTVNTANTATTTATTITNSNSGSNSGSNSDSNNGSNSGASSISSGSSSSRHDTTQSETVTVVQPYVLRRNDGATIVQVESAPLRSVSRALSLRTGRDDSAAAPAGAAAAANYGRTGSPATRAASLGQTSPPERDLSRHMVVKIHCNDGSTKSIAIDDTMTCSELVQLLAAKKLMPQTMGMTLVEWLPNLGLEHVLEDHVRLAPLLRQWPLEQCGGGGGGAGSLGGGDGGRSAVRSNQVRLSERLVRYEMFLRPECHLLPEVCTGRTDERQLELTFCLDETAREKLIQENFEVGVYVPNAEGHLWLKEPGKSKWRRLLFTLTANGFCYRQKSLLGASKMVPLCSLSENQIYLGFKWEVPLKAPTQYSLALKPAHVYRPAVAAQSIHYLCADSYASLVRWWIALRLAKYGQQLLKNFRQTQLLTDCQHQQQLEERGGAVAAATATAAGGVGAAVLIHSATEQLGAASDAIYDQPRVPVHSAPLPERPEKSTVFIASDDDFPPPPPLPPHPAAVGFCANAPSHTARRVHFVDQRSPPPRCSATFTPPPAAAASTSIKLPPPPADFLRDLTQVIDGKVRVAVRCNSMHQLPHQVLGVQEPGSGGSRVDPTPAAAAGGDTDRHNISKEAQVGRWLRQHYGTAAHPHHPHNPNHPHHHQHSTFGVATAGNTASGQWHHM